MLADRLRQVALDRGVIGGLVVIGGAQLAVGGRQQPDRPAKQDHRCRHMHLAQSRRFGVAIRLALLAPDTAGLRPRGRSRHGTTERQSRVAGMAKALGHHGGPQGQHRRSVDLQQHAVNPKPVRVAEASADLRNARYAGNHTSTTSGGSAG